MPAYRDKDGARWYVKFRYKDWKNDTKWVTKRGFKTKRDAVEWERDFLTTKSGDVSMTFEQFVSIYKKERLPRLKQSTQLMKENIIDTKILPYFGKRKLNEISSADIIQWQNLLLTMEKPAGSGTYASSYLKTVHNQLSAIFNYAIRHYGLKSNPAAIAGNMGSEDGISMKFWTKEQYLCFAESVMEEPLAYYAFEILYWCGIREGELLALTREDIDLEHGHLSVTKTFCHLKGKDIVTTPKTPKSRRVVSIPEFLCEELKDYFDTLYDCGKGDRIFPVTKNYLRRQLRKHAGKQGIPTIRVHDLRHSHVSLLIDMGFSPVAIADRVGHESIDITYRYAHLFPSVQTQMSQRLNESREGGGYVEEES